MVDSSFLASRKGAGIATTLLLAACSGGSSGSSSSSGSGSSMGSISSPSSEGSQITVTRLPVGCASYYATSGFTLNPGTSTDRFLNVVMPTRDDVPFEEPTYKTCIIRVTDRVTDGMGTGAINDYSRRPEFNADSSRLLVYQIDGGNWWL